MVCYTTPDSGCHVTTISGGCTSGVEGVTAGRVDSVPCLSCVCPDHAAEDAQRSDPALAGKSVRAVGGLERWLPQRKS